METGYEMAYFIVGISMLAFISEFYIDKVDFKNLKDKNNKAHH